MKCIEYVGPATATGQRRQCAMTATRMVELFDGWAPVCSRHYKKLYFDLKARVIEKSGLWQR